MNKKYIVELTPEQRATLEQLTRTGTAAAALQRHARMLLKADTGPHGPAWGDAAIAAAVDVSVPTVERVRRQFVTAGLEVALHRKPTSRAAPRKLDGRQEAQLAAIACSPPPEGQSAGPSRCWRTSWWTSSSSIRLPAIPCAWR